MVKLYTFGQPRTGSFNYAMNFKNLNIERSVCFVQALSTRNTFDDMILKKLQSFKLLYFLNRKKPDRKYHRHSKLCNGSGELWLDLFNCQWLFSSCEFPTVSFNFLTPFTIPVIFHRTLYLTVNFQVLMCVICLSYRVVYAADIVPHQPACFKNPNQPPNADGSRPCLAEPSNEAYHHGIEIW